MYLTEKKVFKKKVNIDLYKQLDDYSFKAKNLKNATNYLIKQCSRIGYKLKCGEILFSWEKAFILKVNKAIYEYNKKGHKLKYIDNNNNCLIDSYFLAYYLKNTVDYKALYSTNAQIIIQEVCKDWKSYFEALKDYKKNKSKYLGKPKIPGYLDSDKGRYWFTFTNQNIKFKDGILSLPKSLNFNDLIIKTNKNNIKQVRIKAEKKKITVHIIYNKETKPMLSNNNRYMSIDLGLNNLATVVSNTEMNPFIIDGKKLKSINQGYNKKIAKIQEQITVCNHKSSCKASYNLTNKRNLKVDDYLHKVSRIIVNKALKYNICKIIIGNNKGWKQEVDLGKKTNQSFVNIPYYRFIELIKYKANLLGIEVIIVEESYTSGTSYIDNEAPIINNYNKNRRVKRGLFKSNNGILINSDVNGAYQIMKKANIELIYKGFNESVERIAVCYPVKKRKTKTAA